MSIFEKSLEVVAILVIDNLKQLVSQITEANIPIQCTELEYRDEMERVFQSCTEQISQDLERDFVLLTQEDCEDAIKNFNSNMAIVQERLSELEDSLSDADIFAQEQYANVKSDICKRLLSYVQGLVQQTKNISETNISRAEARDVYFTAIKPSDDDLGVIYNNLSSKNWIDGNETSEGDFRHYFGGTGIKPRNYIKWNKSQSYLAAFVDLMTDDRKFLSKASRIFMVPSEGGFQLVSHNSLKSSRNRAMNSNDETYWVYQDEMKKKIFPVKPQLR